jgi:hypothetical protein
MNRPVTLILFLIAMIIVIVCFDTLFFRRHLWERLAANAGVVLVFAAFYFRFLWRQ